MTWEPGTERIRDLLRAGELEQVTPDTTVSRRLLTDAENHLATARAGIEAGDLAGAYQLAYDTLRKSATALLAAQGLRATSRGGHIAVQDAVHTQFASTVRVFRSFSRIRRARNSFEYPDSDTHGPILDDVTDALTTAHTALDAATRILDSGLLTTWEQP